MVCFDDAMYKFDSEVDGVSMAACARAKKAHNRDVASDVRNSSAPAQLFGVRSFAKLLECRERISDRSSICHVDGQIEIEGSSCCRSLHATDESTLSAAAAGCVTFWNGRVPWRSLSMPSRCHRLMCSVHRCFAAEADWRSNSLICRQRHFVPQMLHDDRSIFIETERICRTAGFLLVLRIKLLVLRHERKA